LKQRCKSGWDNSQKTSLLQVLTHWWSSRTNVSMLVGGMSRNKCFIPGLNITCWPIYWLSLIAIHDAVVMYQSLRDNKNINLLKCTHSLAQGLVKRTQLRCSTSCTQLSISWTAANRIYRRTFPGAYSCHRKENKTSKCVVCTGHRKRRQSVYLYSECEVGLC
jgi:hypothetical protein